MSASFPTQAAAILDFYRKLRPGFTMADGISIMNPYREPETWRLASRFYEKFYADSRPRGYVFGINPGRFGAGITGVPFTDPIRLQEKCGIPNDWKKQAELSSVFVYQMIDGYGGVDAFYGQFYITAISPLGFVQQGSGRGPGKNLNYYDDKELVRAIEPFVVRCIRRQMETIPTYSTCYCLGEGANYKYFSRLNEKHGFFSEIIPLPHPRWVMQYRRKRVPEYVEEYVGKLRKLTDGKPR
ncbi:MAG: DUF4918 family protein [Puia sp.]|nr:DUF4918 family protein [Puia sp.]